MGCGGCPVGGFSLVTFTWRCYAPEGPRLPSVWARLFPFLQFTLSALACWPSVSKKKEKKENDFIYRDRLHSTKSLRYMSSAPFMVFSATCIIVSLILF